MPPASFSSIYMQHKSVSGGFEGCRTRDMLNGTRQTHDFDELRATTRTDQPVYLPGPVVFTFMTEDCLPFRVIVIGHEALYSMRATWLVRR